ncbi:glycosyltransferase family 2 protein [Candidatus Margulisiibacteriota bacterium]
MNTSVIIATKNREDDLKECLNSIFSQSQKPSEIIVVESGKQNPSIEKILKKNKASIPTKYMISPKQAVTSQRNLGIKNSVGDIIIFLDDDLVLEDNFIQEILKTFKENDTNIGGVMGNITNIERKHKTKRSINIFYRLFFLNRYTKSGEFTCAGFGTYVHGLSKITPTKYLSAGITAYKREALQTTGGWDENIPGYGTCCDEDISFRVSRKYKNFYTPFARCIHNSSPVSRDSYVEQKAMYFRHRAYIFKKNFAKFPFNWFLFYWSVFGLFLLSIYSKDWPELKGYLSGTRSIIKGQIP